MLISVPADPMARESSTPRIADSPGTGPKPHLRASETTSGIFSLDFSDLLNGIAVGGDYTRPEAIQGTAAFTSNGGKTWAIPSSPPHGYRSGVIAFKTRTGTTALAVGTNGSDISLDRGQT